MARRIFNASATMTLVVVNVIFFFSAILAALFYPNVMEIISLTPIDIMQGKHLWTIITSMFMHVGPFHLFANMFSLIFLGGFLERLIGKKRFLAVYFASGILGGLAYVLLSSFGDPAMPAVGASGAIFGIAGMLAVLTPKMPVYIMFIPIPMPMWLGTIMIMAVLWLLTISVGLPVGNTAHLGGLVAGLAYAAYLRWRYPYRTRIISDHFR